MSKTRGTRLARWRSLRDMPKKQRAAALNPDLPILGCLPPGSIVNQARLTADEADVARCLSGYMSSEAQAGGEAGIFAEYARLRDSPLAARMREEYRMPVSKEAIRDLLLPGLMEFAGAYPTFNRQWSQIFGRTDGEPVRYTGMAYRSVIDVETAARSKERSRSLLKSLLTPEQWAAFEAAGAVTERIEGCEFKLSPGGMIQVRKPRLLGRAVTERWCIAPEPDDWIPPEDKLIGQLLHLRAGPDKLRAQANVFPGR